MWCIGLLFHCLRVHVNLSEVATSLHDVMICQRLSLLNFLNSHFWPHPKRAKVWNCQLANAAHTSERRQEGSQPPCLIHDLGSFSLFFLVNLYEIQPGCVVNHDQSQSSLAVLWTMTSHIQFNRTNSAAHSQSQRMWTEQSWCALHFRVCALLCGNNKNRLHTKC